MPMYSLPELAKKNNMLERDLIVLDALSAGPATLFYLHRMFFKKSDGKMVSIRTFNDYIKRMANAEYLKLVSYTDLTKLKSSWINRFAVIDARGADLVCRVIPFKEREHVRMNIPSKLQFVHETLLSCIIRNIWQEARARNTFIIEYIYDESIQRRLITRQRGRLKGFFFSDLHVRIHPFNYSPITIHMEVDSGQKTRGYWVEKVSSLDTLVLVVCIDPQRIKYLSHYVESNKAKLKGAVCFIAYKDFLKSGLTYWFATLKSIGDTNKTVYLYKDYSKD